MASVSPGPPHLMRGATMALAYYAVLAYGKQELKIDAFQSIIS